MLTRLYIIRRHLHPCTLIKLWENAIWLETMPTSLSKNLSVACVRQQVRVEITAMQTCSFFREATRVGAVLTLWFAACHSPHPAQASFLIHPVGSKFHFVVSCLCEAMSEIKPKQKKKKNAVCPFNTIIALIDYTLNYALKMLTQLIMSGLELRLSL